MGSRGKSRRQGGLEGEEQEAGWARGEEQGTGRAYWIGRKVDVKIWDEGNLKGGHQGKEYKCRGIPKVEL